MRQHQEIGDRKAFAHELTIGNDPTGQISRWCRVEVCRAQICACLMQIERYLFSTEHMAVMACRKGRPIGKCCRDQRARRLPCVQFGKIARPTFRSNPPAWVKFGKGGMHPCPVTFGLRKKLCPYNRSLRHAIATLVPRSGAQNRPHAHLRLVQPRRGRAFSGHHVEHMAEKMFHPRQRGRCAANARHDAPHGKRLGQPVNGQWIALPYARRPRLDPSPHRSNICDRAGVKVSSISSLAAKNQSPGALYIGIN